MLPSSLCLLVLPSEGGRASVLPAVLVPSPVPSPPAPVPDPYPPAALGPWVGPSLRAAPSLTDRRPSRCPRFPPALIKASLVPDMDHGGNSLTSVFTSRHDTVGRCQSRLPQTHISSFAG